MLVDAVPMFTFPLLQIKYDVGPPLILPLLIVTFPLHVKVNPFKFIFPEFNVKLVMFTLFANVGILAAAAITTWSLAVGTPAGAQFAAVFQLLDVEPFQV